jgi:putative ABC transport system permease protein
MNFLETVGMAAKTLTTNKLRSTLTMLGIIIGNASVIATIAVVQGAKQFAQQKIESFGPNQLTIAADAYYRPGLNIEKSELLLSDVEAIIALSPAVKAVAPQISKDLSLSYRDRTAKANVTGTTQGILYARMLRVERGRFFDRIEQQQIAPVAVLGAGVARKLFGTSDPLGQSFLINQDSFHVIGVLQGKGVFLGLNYDETVYIPITTMAERFSGKRSPNGIAIDYLELSARDRDSIRAAAFQVTNILTRRHGKKDFRVDANKSVQNLMNQVTGALGLVLVIIAGISLLVGGIGIMNIMLVSVTERTQEIGLCKAIGATQQAILTQFLIEAIILSVAGGVIGVFIGVSGLLTIGFFTSWLVPIPFGAIILALGFSGSIGLIFGVAPARQAARLDPITALHRS